MLISVLQLAFITLIPVCTAVHHCELQNNKHSTCNVILYCQVSTVLFCIAVAQWNVIVYCNYAIECELYELNLVQYYIVCYSSCFVHYCSYTPKAVVIDNHLPRQPLISSYVPTCYGGIVSPLRRSVYCSHTSADKQSFCVLNLLAAFFCEQYVTLISSASRCLLARGSKGCVQDTQISWIRAGWSKCNLQNTQMAAQLNQQHWGTSKSPAIKAVIITFFFDQVSLKTEVLRTPRSTRPGFELMTSRP